MGGSYFRKCGQREPFQRFKGLPGWWERTRKDGGWLFKIKRTARVWTLRLNKPERSLFEGQGGDEGNHLMLDLEDMVKVLDLIVFHLVHLLYPHLPFHSPAIFFVKILLQFIKSVYLLRFPNFLLSRLLNWFFFFLLTFPPFILSIN